MPAATMPTLFSRFIQFNKQICDAIEARLPVPFTRSLLYLHELVVAEQIKARSDAAVLDVGGGKKTPFAAHRAAEARSWLIGADILERNLRENSGLDSRVVADACAGLPFKDDSIDIVAARSVLEHLPDNAEFLRECGRILKRGGLAICVMPSRRAPFALLNRVLPDAMKRKLLFAFFPEWEDDCGFRAYYDRCSWPAMGRAFEAAGFRLERVEYRYYQSIYFKMFAPLFALSLLYDLLIWRLSARPLCCQMLIVARRM
jgi:ubiquinone/menaquinone biosynthesis C-methylase UbiE